MREGDDRHRFYEQLAVTHVLGGLSESDGHAFRSHLLECGQCRARVGELRSIAHDLADVERDERRVRAAKAIETKRRDDDTELELDDPPPPSRFSRTAVIVVIGLLFALTAWNFALRNQLARQNVNIDASQAATDLLIDGQFPTAAVERPGAVLTDRSTVRYDDEFVVVVADGVTKGETYGVYQLSADGDVVNPGFPRRSTSDRMVLGVPRADVTTQVVVSRLGNADFDPTRVVGDQVLRASLAPAG